jgi:DNA-binding SARP family transcriptional activator/tetratricopeptide (TPR) repeat protein
LRTNHLRLITLGRLALVSPSGDDEPLSRRRRQLAVLAVLALNARPVRREQLVEMFWGDEDEDRARHSLSNALSSLRGCIGATAIAARQTDVGLSSDAPLGVDALEFSAACEASDHERAVALYGGPFLDGVVVPDSVRFDGWVARERARLERQFLHACEALCTTLSRARRWDECAALAARWLDALPPSRAAAIMMLSALAAPGTREALHSALTAYDVLARRLEMEYESPPDPRVTLLAAGFREQMLLAPDITLFDANSAWVASPSPAAADSRNIAPETMSPPGAATSAITPEHVSQPRASNRRRTLAMWAAGAAIAAGVIAAAGYHARSTRQSVAAARTRPSVAVTNVVNVRRDTSIAWLEDGLKQMIAADLSHSSAIDVVPPSRVHDVLARAGYASGTAIPTEQATDVARRVNATLAVSVELSHGGGGYVVGINVFNVADGKLLRMSTVTGTDILSVADAVAARVLDVVNSTADAPHFADIETSSPEAYRHFVRGMQASAAGQFPDDEHEMDAALALDPGFVSAITARRDLAIKHGEFAMAARMDSAFARNANRASGWDRSMDEASRAFHNGEVARAEALARNIVATYPSDPRGYAFLSDVLMEHGRWLAADTVLRAELALDSLAVAAGHGPCAPCLAYHGMADSRRESGDLAGAARAARAWVALQPDLPDAWVTLANTLAISGRPDEAVAAGEHGASLTSDPFPAISVGRWLIMGRRYDAAEAYAAKLQESTNPQLRYGGDDIAGMVARERGQLRAANRIFERTEASFGPTDPMHLLHADDLARLGDFTGARKEFAAFARLGPTDGSQSLSGDDARAFTWPRALEADALAASGDTALLRSIADSLEQVGPRSYYGRDWTLFHHVRGLIAMHGKRYDEAEREFRAARWGYAGWTRTVAELAQAQLAQGRARDAITTLRHAYASAPDAMGRYMPRSEIDLRMSNAFRAAGMLDSARVYGEYVTRAWAHADPEVKRLVVKLPNS